MRRVGVFRNEGLEQSEGAENLNALGNSVWQTDHLQHVCRTCMRVLSCWISQCAIHMRSLLAAVWRPGYLVMQIGQLIPQRHYIWRCVLLIWSLAGPKPLGSKGML